MNPTPINPELLEDLLLGRLAVGQTDSLCNELESRGDVAEMAAAATSKDILLDTVCSSHGAGIEPTERMRRLIERLQDRRTFTDILDDSGTMNGDASTAERVGLTDMFAPAQQPDEIGRLGTYRVLEVLGEGGMGAVFLAEDTLLQRRVALKVMKPTIAANLDSRERFLREARSAARIEHDYIIPIFQVGVENGVPFLAMPLLKGMSLDDRFKIARGSLPMEEVLRVGREAAEGLAAAHARGLVHRDIKPGNIWLEEREGGMPPRVKILDFGLARPEKEETHLTRSGAVVGTPAYMSPEQGRGLPVDQRADLFSLGCVLYQIATGKRPFTGPNTMAILTSLALDTPVEPSKVNPQIPIGLSRIIMRMLEKDPARRPESGKKVAEMLRRIEIDSTLPIIEALDVPMAAPVATPGDPWEEIDDSVADVPNAPQAADAKPKSKPPQKGGAPWSVLIALGGLAAGILVALTVIIIRDKNGKEVARIEVPEGGSFEVAGGKKKDPPVKKEPAAESKEVVKTVPPLDPDWIARVEGMNPVDQVRAVTAELIKRNPGLEDRFVKASIIPGFVNGVTLPAEIVTDISPLSALKQMTYLTCTATDRNGKLTDLTPLRGLRITNLTLNGNGALRNLEPLRGMPLVGIGIVSTAVEDLSPLRDAPLTSLTLVGSRVSDLTPLRGKMITSLVMNLCPVNDLSPLRGMPLENLVISNSQIIDLRPLRGMPLKTLTATIRPGDADILRSLTLLEKVGARPVAEVLASLPPLFPPLNVEWVKKVEGIKAEEQIKEVAAELKRRNPGFDEKAVIASVENEDVTTFAFPVDLVTDITPLRVLKRLAAIHCIGSKSKRAKLADLTPLRGLQLKVFKLLNTSVVDLDPLRDMPLNEIHLVNSPVDDLLPLRGKNLTFALIAYTSITDLTPLKGLPLTTLQITGSPVSDIEPLIGMKLEKFAGKNTKVTDMSPLRGMPITELTWDIVTERDAEIVRSLVNLTKINDKPAAEVLAGLARQFPPLDPAWVLKFQALDAKDQVLEFSAEMKRRNPGFNGDVTPAFDGNTLVGLELTTDNVTDIAPLRAIKSLKRLACTGSDIGRGKLVDLSPLMGLPLTFLDCARNPTLSNLGPLRQLPQLEDISFAWSSVADLTPLQDLPLTNVRCDRILCTDYTPLAKRALKRIVGDFRPERDAAFLRSIKTLESINEKPVDEFWKEFEPKK